MIVYKPPSEREVATVRLTEGVCVHIKFDQNLLFRTLPQSLCDSVSLRLGHAQGLTTI